MQLDLGDFYQGTFSITAYGYQRLKKFSPFSEEQIERNTSEILDKMWRWYISPLKDVQAFAWLIVIVMSVAYLCEAFYKKRVLPYVFVCFIRKLMKYN